MLDKDLKKTLDDMLCAVQQQRHQFVTVEHLLLALLDNQSAAAALKACNVDLKCLYQGLG